jgi:hypothetical protein
MIEINEGDQNYLDPLFFSANKYHKGYAKVYLMKKQTTAVELKINPNIKTSIVHDSIWNYMDELDILAISLTRQGQGDFFQGLSKVISLRDFSVAEILDYCVEKRVERIGFIPWSCGNYSSFFDKIKNYKKEYPKVISLFHLNRKDFNSVKELA